MGGPLIVIPVSALTSWGGCTAESGLMAGDATAPDDYDRACAVDDLAGVIPIDENGAQGLVLADLPATSCYLPQHRAFLRWLAADSEAGLSAAADAVLADPATVWEECAGGSAPRKHGWPRRTGSAWSNSCPPNPERAELRPPGALRRSDAGSHRPPAQPDRLVLGKRVPASRGM
ncbi:Imm21 family immunity protein [Streptomyces sp. NPDC056202]|uniref:Imm21 family immunity protein n=1 Tax=Streptomyces sp. NPDC056202 TaxID=3345745 RepID=UPI0035E22DED